MKPFDVSRTIGGPIAVSAAGLFLVVHFYSLIPREAQPRALRTVVVGTAIGFSLALRRSLRRGIGTDSEELKGAAFIATGALPYTAYVFLKRFPEVFAPLLGGMTGALMGGAVGAAIWWTRAKSDGKRDP